MAVAVASTSTAAFASGTSVTIPKPSGLAVNDLLIAHIGFGNGPTTVTAPAGWTQVRGDNSDIDAGSYIFRKIADSADVAATNFVFTLAATRTCAGAIMRITGHSLGNPVQTSAGGYDANPGSGSITLNFDDGGASPAVTPLVASSMLIMFIVGDNHNNNTAYSTYAVGTSNPSWTEAYEFTDAGGVNETASLAAAYAIRPQTTSTSSMSAAAANSTSTADFRGQIIVINPSKDISVSDTVTMTDVAKLNLSILIRDTVTLTDTVSVAMTRTWRTFAKTALAAWRNLDKS